MPNSFLNNRNKQDTDTAVMQTLGSDLISTKIIFILSVSQLHIFGRIPKLLPKDRSELFALHDNLCAVQSMRRKKRLVFQTLFFLLSLFKRHFINKHNLQPAAPVWENKSPAGVTKLSALCKRWFVRSDLPSVCKSSTCKSLLSNRPPVPFLHMLHLLCKLS